MEDIKLGQKYVSNANLQAATVQLLLGKIAKDPDWLAGNAKVGGIPAIRSQAETERYVRDQYELYEKLATSLGIRQ